MVLTMLTTIEPSMAGSTPSSVKPKPNSCPKYPTNQNKNTFNTNNQRPKVRIMKGKVKNLKIGAKLCIITITNTQPTTVFYPILA